MPWPYPQNLNQLPFLAHPINNPIWPMNDLPNVFDFEFRHDPAKKRKIIQPLRFLDNRVTKLFRSLLVVAADECDQPLQGPGWRAW